MTDQTISTCQLIKWNEWLGTVHSAMSVPLGCHALGHVTVGNLSCCWASVNPIHFMMVDGVEFTCICLNLGVKVPWWATAIVEARGAPFICKKRTWKIIVFTFSY